MAIITKWGRRGAIILLKTYQYWLSPFVGYHCRFHPSCSNYMLVAIERFGVAYGVWLGSKRLLRCHPWCEGGIDEVPIKFRDQ